MKLRDYLKDKIFVIVLVVLTYGIITSFMIGFKIIDEFRWCFTVIYFLLFIILFLYDYLRKYFFYKEMSAFRPGPYGPLSAERRLARWNSKRENAGCSSDFPLPSPHIR